MTPLVLSKGPCDMTAFRYTEVTIREPVFCLFESFEMFIQETSRITGAVQYTSKNVMVP
jgi:hypothetical protein